MCCPFLSPVVFFPQFEMLIGFCEGDCEIDFCSTINCMAFVFISSSVSVPIYIWLQTTFFIKDHHQPQLVMVHHSASFTVFQSNHSHCWVICFGHAITSHHCSPGSCEDAQRDSGVSEDDASEANWHLVGSMGRMVTMFDRLVEKLISSFLEKIMFD